MIKTICAWCASSEELRTPHVSHGLCASCAEKMMRPLPSARAAFAVHTEKEKK
jgi:hypothetical protein